MIIFYVGFFDGTQINGIGGVGFFLKLKKDPVFRLKWGFGEGSNTRAELLMLWHILLHIVGDSKVVIDWILELQI